MNDLWEEGYGAAIGGCDWLGTVAGRFLKGWERRALAAGWREGLRDLDAFEKDMERHECFEASVSLERAGPAWDEVPL